MIPPAFSLLSFCPSSGIGLYASGTVMRGFDLVTEEDYEIGPTGERSSEGVADFASHVDLLRFATTEYLRDKKHTYYSTILTEDVEEGLRDDIVRFLDAEELATLDMTDDVLTTLRVIGSASRALQCLRRAERLACEQVVTCLWTNFPTLLESPRIVQTWPSVLIEQHAPEVLTRRSRPHPHALHWLPLGASSKEYEPDTEQYVMALTAGDTVVQQHFFLYFARRFQKLVPTDLSFMAEDIVLDALSRTMKSLHRHGLKKPWHLHAFAASTLRHSIHDARRAEERYVPLGEHLLAPVDQAVDVLLIASRAGEARTVSPISEIDVTKALEQLQAHEPRAALVLQLRLQGQSLEEVATLLRVTPGAASHLSSLGIRWLRKHLGTEKGKP